MTPATSIPMATASARTPRPGEPLELLIPASSDTTGAVESGQFIVGFLEQIGISVDLRPVSDAKMNDYWGAGNFDAYIWYWSGDPDPNYQLFVFTSDQCGSWSDGCWKDPEFDALYEQQGAMMDRDERQQVVFDAQRRVYDQIPGRGPRLSGVAAGLPDRSPRRLGAASRARTATCCPATTTTRWSSFER